ARAIGPAIAGLLIAQVGAGAVFALNAASYVVLVLVLLGMRRPGSVAEEAAPERLLGAMRAGQRYVRHSPVVRRMLLRVGLFVLPGAALWALLPLVASRLLGTGSTGYGLLLAALGAGAVLGADLLPRLGAQWVGLVPAFVAAAAVMALGTASVVVWPLRDVAGLSRDLAVFMPDPELARDPDPDEGPVLVTLTYRVDDDRVPAFLDAMA